MIDQAGMANRAWGRAEIEQLLAAEDFRYQNVELPYGLSTGGEDRTATVEAIFPEDLGGRSVLDLGCNFGYFCFEAIKRGAGRVVGVDVDPDTIRKARLLADCLGAKVEFRLLDLETGPLEQDFDHILCLNLLHHLKDPIALLERLIPRARRSLVLEVAGLGSHDRRKLGLSHLSRFVLARAPVVYVGRNGTSGRHGGQKFFITETALENLLVYQRNMFARLRPQPSPHKGRYIVIAERRRIGELILVAGPTSSGKSRLIERLRAGAEPALAARLGIGEPGAWPAWNAFDLLVPSEPELDRLLFHYDTLRPFMRSAHVHARDEALDILECAERVRVLTIWNPPACLLAQLEDAEIKPKTRFGAYRGNRRKAKIHALYQDPARIVGHFRAWFAYCRGRGVETLVVLPHEGLRLISVEEWERDHAGRA